MEVSVEHLGGVQFEITARQHSITCDQPLEDGGYDEGMTPPELLLASLGSCVGFYVAMYLKKRSLATEGTRVHVSAEKAKAPPRMENFRIRVEVPAEFSQDQKRGIEEAAHRCLIHNTLLHAPNISLELQSVALANS